MKTLKFILSTFILMSNVIYSQGFGEVSDVPPMNVPRYGHASVSLSNGHVLVVGGHTQGFLTTSTAEIYDPQNETWTLYNIDNPHDGCSFVSLNDGKIMFFGGYSNALGVGQSTVTTIFNPETNEFTVGPPMNVARGNSSAVKLTDNRILIVGNWYNTGDAEIYDPSTNTFTSIGIPVSERANPLVFPCNDGSAVIIGGYGNYGNPNFTDVVHFDPISMEFATLSSELISGETGWTTFWSSGSSELSEMRLSNGNYIFLIYKSVSSSEYYYGLAQFNPQTKEISKFNASPEFPVYTGSSPNEWALGINVIKDPASDYVYIFAVGSNSSPYLARLYSFDPGTGSLEIPEGQASFDYYLYTASKSMINGDILCSGGTLNGSNFDITNQAKLIRPQNSLNVERHANDSGVNVFPNPVSRSTFEIQSQHKGIQLIELIDLQGRAVKQIQVNKNDQSHQIDRIGIPNGVYFLRMSGSNSVITAKIILQ